MGMCSLAALGKSHRERGDECDVGLAGSGKHRDKVSFTDGARLDT